MVSRMIKDKPDAVKRPPRQRNLALLNENAVTVDFDFARILASDPKNIRAQKLSEALYIDKYQGSISEAAASALGSLWPAKSVKRSMMVVGKSVTTVASVDSVSVYLKFDYSAPGKPALSVSILGEGSEQSKAVQEVRKIKESYGG